jgi:hypothetical protein
MAMIDGFKKKYLSIIRGRKIGLVQVIQKTGEYHYCPRHLCKHPHKQ